MAELVNLRQRRKQAARDGREKEAAANRAKFGETKESRLAREAEAARKESALAAHRREPE